MHWVTSAANRGRKNPTVAEGLVPFDVQRGVIRCTKISVSGTRGTY